MYVGRNDEDINKEMDVREDDKPLETDEASLDDEVGTVYKPDDEGADDEPYTESNDDPAEQHDLIWMTQLPRILMRMGNVTRNPLRGLIPC